ncbi:MAG: ATP-binding cassette domain-containing protein [Bacillota bacterium]|nr:ATP-binding cassette domain-containing protein [Bacillota bacterium]
MTAILGPSGCGKTTLLRIIAGLIKQNKGDIYFNDKIINHLPTQERNAAMVFQNYALFLHLSVKDNIAYGLKNQTKEKNN